MLCEIYMNNFMYKLKFCVLDLLGEKSYKYACSG